MLGWKKSTSRTAFFGTSKGSQRHAFTPRWTLAALLALLSAGSLGFHASMGAAAETDWIQAVELADPHPTTWDLYDYGVMEYEQLDAVVFGSKLVFSARSDVYGTELWITDGTPAGTELLKDIADGTNSSSPSSFVVFGDIVLFRANDGTHGMELWVTDGTSDGTQLLRDINPGGDSYPQQFTAFGNQLLFTADDGSSGTELWVTDGTQAGTQLLKDVRPGSTYGGISYLTPFGDVVLFRANDGTHGSEVWVTDGTTGGTQLLKDVRPGGEAYPENFTILGEIALFTATDDTYGREAWVTDGTTSGTQLLKDIRSGSSDSSPYEFVVSGDKALFQADDGVVGREVWVTDGTSDGTQLLMDANSGSSSGNPGSLTVLGDQWLFRATDTNLGREFFVSDGTPDGTSLLMDINSGTPDGYPDPIGIADDVLYFYATDSSNGTELWATDGTADGTRLVYDINPGSDSSYPRDFVAVPGGFVFDANNGSGNALWASDGTPGNTELIAAGGENSFPTLFAYSVDFPLIGNTLIVNTGSQASTSSIWGLSFGQRVSFSANCATGNLVLDDIFLDSGEGVIQRSVSCDGFYFTGWNTAADGSGTTYSQGESVTLTDNLSLYAQWAPEPVLHFDANGGSFPGAAPELSGQPDSYVVVPSTQPVRDDHFFLGWRASIDASEPLVTYGYSFQLPSAAGTITLYAQWAQAVTVDFSANGGSGGPEPVHGQELTITALPSEAPTRSGFIFAGWHTTQDGSGNRYQPGEPFIIPTSDTTLYASWTVAGGSTSSVHPFTDVGDGSYYSEHVATLYQQGITIGVTPSAYGPAQLVTRGQMAAFLARTYEVTTGSACIGSHPFTDVTDNTYFAHDVGCLYSLGVTIGTSPTTFSPDRELNRGEMAAFLARMFDAVNGGSCSGTHSFVDVPQASFYAGAVGCLKANNITTGTSASHYSPHLAVDRGQMAAFLARLMAVLD